MKIILINPLFEERYSVGSSRSLKYVLNIILPLGLGYLAAVLRNDGHQVEILDFSVETFPGDFFSKIKRNKPDIIGITSSTSNFESSKCLALRIKEASPGSITVLGGAHVTAIPEQAMDAGCFDIGVLGEGEDTFLELAQELAKNQAPNLSNIKGLIFKQDGKYLITPRREFIQDLDRLPYPALDLLPPLKRYRPTPASYQRLPQGVIMTSRGCPHRCTFCDRSVFGNTYRKRSAENVLGEVEEVIDKYGAREIRFFDDCFAQDKERVHKICQGLKKIKKRVPWTCLTTVVSVSKDLLKEMQSAGCWQVLFGLESADKGILSRLKKGASLEQNIQAVKWAKQAGLSVRGDFIVGTPGETEDSLKKTLDFAIKMKLDYAHFNKFVPYPGTSLYKTLTENGHNFDFRQGASITDHLRPLYFPPKIRREDYLKFINYAHKKFYLRPGYLFRRLLSLRTLDEFRGQLRGFLAMTALPCYKEYPQ